MPNPNTTDHPRKTTGVKWWLRTAVDLVSIGCALRAVLGIIGIAGLPDDVKTWQSWVEWGQRMFSDEPVFWFVLLGASVVIPFLVHFFTRESRHQALSNDPNQQETLVDDLRVLPPPRLKLFCDEASCEKQENGEWILWLYVHNHAPFEVKQLTFQIESIDPLNRKRESASAVNALYKERLQLVPHTIPGNGFERAWLLMSWWEQPFLFNQKETRLPATKFEIALSVSAITITGEKAIGDTETFIVARTKTRLSCDVKKSNQNVECPLSIEFDRKADVSIRHEGKIWWAGVRVKNNSNKTIETAKLQITAIQAFGFNKSKRQSVVDRIKLSWISCIPYEQYERYIDRALPVDFPLAADDERFVCVAEMQPGTFNLLTTIGEWDDGTWRPGQSIQAGGYYVFLKAYADESTFVTAVLRVNKSQKTGRYSVKLENNPN